MLHFDLEKPIDLLWFGEFLSPERDYTHLTRALYEYELMIVTDGVLFIADEHEEYEVRAGEYLVMSPTRFQHGTRVCKCRFYWMHFRAPALPASVSIPAHGRYEDDDALRAIASLLFESEREEPRSLRSRYLATQLLLEMGHAGARSAKNGDGRSGVCEKIKNYVERHRFSDVRVADIAKELGYHEKYLSAVFRREEGTTIKRYLTERRLRDAKRVLIDTDYTVQEAAYYLNFQSPHNFSRFFKKETGLTPSLYREQTRAEGETPSQTEE